MNIRSLQCIFYDFDGVMTDNRVYIDQNGLESVCVSRADGYGVRLIREAGVDQVIISTEKNPVVTRRAEKLSISVIQSISDKGLCVRDYCEKKGYSLQQTLFVGNDLNDMTAFQTVGYRGAPLDAEPEILKLADWISKKKGGDGVIRDLYRYLMTSPAGEVNKQ